VTAIGELYRQVYEHPDDDAIRHVLADALIAAGDPRGELIQLQLQPDSDHELRAMRLLQRHGLTWLGELRHAVVPIAYERGFLAACRVTDPTDLCDRDEWSTVHTIELSCPDTFELHPVMRSLRVLERAQRGVLERLLAQPFRRLDTMTLHCAFDGELIGVLARLPHDTLTAIRVEGVPANRRKELELAARRQSRLGELDLRAAR